MTFTIADLALAVGKDENYVRQHIRRKHLVGRKEGRRVLVEESEAAKWAKERGLPFRRTIATLGLDDEIGERAARITVLALRTPDGTAINCSPWCATGTVIRWVLGSMLKIPTGSAK